LILNLQKTTENRTTNKILSWNHSRFISIAIKVKKGQHIVIPFTKRVEDRSRTDDLLNHNQKN